MAVGKQDMAETWQFVFISFRFQSFTSPSWLHWGKAAGEDGWKSDFQEAYASDRYLNKFLNMSKGKSQTATWQNSPLKSKCLYLLLTSWRDKCQWHFISPFSEFARQKLIISCSYTWCMCSIPLFCFPWEFLLRQPWVCVTFSKIWGPPQQGTTAR